MPDISFLVRLATDADAFEISELDALLFPDRSFNETTVKKEMQLGAGFVAVADQRLAGVALLRYDEDLADVIRLGVHPEYQGKGIGSALLHKAIEPTRDTALTVAKTNETAIRLYQKNGFSIVGTVFDSWVMLRIRRR